MSTNKPHARFNTKEIIAACTRDSQETKSTIQHVQAPMNGTYRGEIKNLCDLDLANVPTQEVNIMPVCAAFIVCHVPVLVRVLPKPFEGVGEFLEMLR